MASNDRDRLIQTFMARNGNSRRKRPPGYKPEKKSTLPAAMTYRPKKQAKY